MKRHRSARTPPLSCLVLFAGCTSGELAPHEVVRDSAGVSIIDNLDRPDPARWTVGAPVLVLGDDIDAEGFGLIVGVLSFDDGTIAVADAIARSVRLFDDSGTALGSTGRRGEGPGEFEGLAGMWRIDGGRTGVWDARLGRTTVLESDGSLVFGRRLEATGERVRHMPIGVVSDGRLIVQSDARIMPSLPYYRSDLRLLAFDSAGAVDDTLVAVPGAEMWDWEWEMGTTPSLIPFGRSTRFAVHGDALYVGANEGYQIDRYDVGGRLVQRIRLDREAALLTADRIEAFKQAERDKATSSQTAKGGNELFGRLAEDAPYPDRLPHYGGIVVDDGGRLWVHDTAESPDAPTRFTVFGADGRLAGVAEFPSEFTPVEIRGGRALGIWRDALGVEHVRVYILNGR